MQLLYSAVRGEDNFRTHGGIRSHPTALLGFSSFNALFTSSVWTVRKSNVEWFSSWSTMCLTLGWFIKCVSVVLPGLLWWFLEVLCQKQGSYLLSDVLLPFWSPAVCLCPSPMGLEDRVPGRRDCLRHDRNKSVIVLSIHLMILMNVLVRW